MDNLFDLQRKDFMNQVNHFVHPSEEVSDPLQLKGRDVPLMQLRDAFETNGMNAFVWGLRGVGKTSLVHTACQKFSNQVRLAAALSCHKTSTAQELMNDLFRRVAHAGKVNLTDSKIGAKLSAYGLTIEAQKGGFKESLKIDSVNHASDFLDTILPADFEKGRQWIVIVDEFDLLENKDTIDFFTALAKQLSVDKVNVKFVFCGVASNLNDLIGSHESVERYLKAVELRPLLDGHIMEIVNYIAENFDIRLLNGQVTRVAQISCGYPHFAHLIMREVLVHLYDLGKNQKQVSPDTFKASVQNASRSAATRLHVAYDAATKKGTDKYIEVLWSVADGQLMEKQFKNIHKDYLRIMEGRSGRDRLVDEQQFRNHLNALVSEGHGEVLRRGKVGWYRFSDPMFRSYVRMVAHGEDVDLGEESFRR
jgi:hypothetical protein